MNTLLLDLGSTSIKWAILSIELGECHQVPFPKEKDLSYPYFEVDINKITQIIIEIIDSIPDLQKILISTQMHGYLLANSLKEPLTPYISWRDERATLVPYPYKISKEHGVDLKPNLPIASLYALSILQPKLYNQATEFFTLGSYIAYYLTGNNKTHITDAAASGFYNARTCICDEDNLLFPQVTKEMELVGKYKNIDVFTPVGDQQASILGTSPNPDCYILNLGTAAQICTISDSFITGEFESRPYFHGKTLCTVTRLLGGDYIKNHLHQDLEIQLYENYFHALYQLPKRKKLIVTGGVIKYQEELIKKVVEKLNIPYSFYSGLDALKGLKLLAEEIL